MKHFISWTELIAEHSKEMGTAPPTDEDMAFLLRVVKIFQDAGYTIDDLEEMMD